MATTLKFLLKMCKPNAATPSEIVFAAWDYMKDNNLDERQMLEKLPLVEKVELRNASNHILGALDEDAGGIVVGTSVPKNFEESDFFVPRAFLEQIVEGE